MSLSGIQITIPDFDEDELNSTPVAFGKSGGQSLFGGFGAASSSGQDSPTATTPTPSFGERGYFPSHSRGDSVASEDSSHSVSTRYTAKSSTPFAHSAQSSIAQPSGFTRKSSFASIRAAFKSSGKSNDAPPVPHIDHQAYPVLKNPFNKSATSLVNPLARVPSSNPSSTMTATPPYHRPPTPGSNDGRASSRPASSKSRGHGYAKSHTSQSGSIFHNSDGGSDYGQGHPFSPSPPPVPRVPNAFGPVRNDTPDFEEDKVIMDPKTPSDYALHAVFIRFATTCEAKIDAFLKETFDSEPLLADTMGPGVDPKFDDILNSLGKIAQKHTKPVVDSIMRWRRSQTENVGSDIIRTHMAQSPSPARVRLHDVPGLLNERKSLASIYIMCRALIAVLQTISKDALGETMGYSLEETTFEQFRRPDLKLLTQSANHRTNAELYATLLGHISNVRFVSVTDRFLAELGPVAHGQVPKDLDMKYENLVKGINHIQVKVWPPEAFEEGAEFLESLSKSFVHAHGLRFKIAFAETLVKLLHPIGKTAQAETNNPQWAKAIELIYPKAREMMSKPRYWHVAFPLVITSLCVAPSSYFLKNWIPCFEAALSKVKEKPYRIPVMNGMIRLVWTYLYRCQESASTTHTKLDTLLRHFFPANRVTIFPADDHLEPFIHIIHFVLSRHFEFGRDFCLELMQEPAISQAGNLGTQLAPERTAIAIQAILLSLHAIEKETPTPTWPTATDFSVFPSWEDYPSSSEFVPPSFLSKPGMQEFFDRCGSTLAKVATACSHAVGQMSIFDDQWSYARLSPAYEESHNYVIRRHPEGGTIAYSNNLIPQISMLQTCFQSWPRCLHPTLPMGDAIDMLVRGTVHVEPLVGEVATAALKRFMTDGKAAITVMAGLTNFLFDPQRISHEGSGTKLLISSPLLLNLWVGLVDSWIRDLTSHSLESLGEDESAIAARCNEIEAGALFLLSSETWNIHILGVKVMRILGLLVAHISPEPSSPSDRPVTFLPVVELLHGKGGDKSYLKGYNELLDQPELARLEQWQQSTKVDIPLRIADSENEKDRKIWRHLFPVFIHSCMEHSSVAAASFRDSVVAAASKFHPIISHLAGLSNRAPVGFSHRPMPSEKDGSRLVSQNKLLIDQWHLWLKVLCSTATLSESNRAAMTQIGRDHSRAPSDVNFERERLSTTRGLFRYLTPYLDSEYTPFRDAAVLCISSFPAGAYPQLLDDLSLLAGRQFYDDPRSKSGPTLTVDQSGLPMARQLHDDKFRPAPATVGDRTRRQERLYSAVARIYYLTAHYLQLQRASGRQLALANVLKFVRNTQAFLTAADMRDNFTLQRLRRYFCGTVERLFDGLAALTDSDRFIPPNMHLSLYRLCEEWCQFGPQAEGVKQRLILMQRAAAASSNSDTDVNQSVKRFQNETLLLSHASVGALSSLCQKAYFPAEQSSDSPIDRTPPEFLKPLTAHNVLERFGAILSSEHQVAQARGKRALQALLNANTHDASLLEESLHRAIVVTDQPDSSHVLVLEVISDLVCNNSHHAFTFAQIVCLGLSNLCHPLSTIRRLAFNMLEAIHQQTAGLLTMSQFEAAASSPASATHVHAHKLISDFLAGEHPDQAAAILAQFTDWLPHFHHHPTVANVPLLLLQSLEFWISNIELMTEDKTSLSRDGHTALYHLMALMLRFGQSHTEQVLTLWTRLVEPPHQSNGHATVRFLLEQSNRVGSSAFIDCAAEILACLCQTAIGRPIFEELCSVIEPARMLPAIDHKLAFPDADDMELWADLDALFASNEPKLALGSAQFAWLFLADVSLPRYWELKPQLPVLLHTVFAHLDHRTTFVRARAQRMLFQILRSWAPGYDELVDRASHPPRSALKASISSLETEAQNMYWKEDETGVDVEPKMKWLCSEVVRFLLPLCPMLPDLWGSLALHWGTSCSIRATAFRSLQIYRAIMVRATPGDLALLLGRLSNTIAGPDENIRSFTAEIMRTMHAMVSLPDLDSSMLPQMFWCALASLSTTAESEFAQTLKILETLLHRVNLDDPDTSELLLARQPLGWNGPEFLQPVLLTGLRSSTTCDATMRILRALTKIQDDRFIDPTRGRLRDLYTVALPWCLHAMTPDAPNDPALKEFAEDISILAQQEGRQNIQKIMTSFVKGHFRTREDFLRQSVASLREHYGVDYWTEIVTLLLGLVLNRQRWLRVQAMQILKVLFQQRETRNPVELLGSELLMPLLRLLETDLAAQALEVLEEPMTMSGGLAAKHVLRMSMHSHSMTKDVNLVATVFGVPEPSGWCVVQADTLRVTCRGNMMAVFDTWNMPSRPSRIDFEPEVEAMASSSPLQEDLGGLVQNLHDLTTFFQDDERSSDMSSTFTVPNRLIEARVAAILAKSISSETVNDTPQTPFRDVFRVGSMSPAEESDEYSDSDSELDAFIFDTPSIYRSAPNGSRFH
ncbi:cell morphogenesis N-terminal-domain-containing protein [Roridomyces roridus]|uniref:Cell morphogenesis N-terminal-domain-containing protein n=1 Tax=Roridomyces roridus TaxID=1738132 RepID=A0AAD7BX23_9AGAR|nr:cell morphogenesis N-terminal-domain-containing protein [Roridomyces roridus]